MDPCARPAPRPILLGWLVCASAAAGLAAELGSIDGPRPPGHVVDTVGLLAEEDVAAIERLADGIEATSGGDLVVVVIRTTGGRQHRAFATDLFNRWELGSAERDDGLLVFVALDDRKAEIVLGDGVDDEPRRRASQRIMDEVLIPEFKAGRPAAGLRRAALACGAEILSAGPEMAPPEGRPEPFGPAPAEVAAPWPALAPPPPPPAGGFLPLALAAGGGVGGTGLSWFLLRRHFRNRPRQCPQCRIDMIRLGERADDAHLRPGQQQEERLGSADYDVWTCPTCPHVSALRYGGFFTSYSRCPGCGFVTASTTVDRVRSPTSWQSGLETINEHCLHCGRAETTSRVIPQLPDASDSAVFSSSSWSSSSDSSGGGSSSGGGASGSW